METAKEENTLENNPIFVTEVDMNGLCVLHIFRTQLGLMFSMSELAVELFKENPGAFQKEVRAGRYKRFHITDEDALLRLAHLQIPSESITVVGATFLPPDSVEAILFHRRKANLVNIIRLALLKIVSADAAKLLGQALFADALPVTLDAIKKGRILYYPHHKLQLVPVYLLGAQANLGLGRTVQSEDMLGVAAWLLVEDDSEVNKNRICAEITRLFGRLYFLERKYDMSLKAYGENIFYTSRQYGHMDLRNSLGIYSLSRVFQVQDEVQKSRRCSDVVVEMWFLALKEVVLNIPYVRMTPWEKPQYPGLEEKPWDFKSQINTMYFKEVTDMLQEISSYRAATSGERDVSVAEVCLVLGLAFLYAQLFALARQHLGHAADLYRGRQTHQAYEAMELVNIALKIIPR
ncbi:unnamed protein product [Calypogeia fissa]